MSDLENGSFYQGGMQFVPSSESRERNRNRVHIWRTETNLTEEQLIQVLKAASLRNPVPKRVFLFFDDGVSAEDLVDIDDLQKLRGIAKGILHTQMTVIEDIHQSSSPTDAGLETDVFINESS